MLLPKVKRLSVTDFEDVFRTKLNAHVRQRIRDYKFEYFECDDSEREHWVNRIQETIDDFGKLRTVAPKGVRDWRGSQHQYSHQKAGKERKKDWTSGWGVNLKQFKENPTVKAIVPKYFGKYPVLRWRQRFIRPAESDFEQNILAIIQYWLFEEYLKEAESIYEFGCGTGHNLTRVRDINPDGSIWGLDWSQSSVELVERWGTQRRDTKVFSRHFDFFDPDFDFKLDAGSVVFTCAALEQVGSNFKPFINYIIEQKPKLCIHIEPIMELLDTTVTLDRLSIDYCRKREYLTGFLEFLRRLETNGKATIVRAQRTYVGSLFIEGYSVVVWFP